MRFLKLLFIALIFTPSLLLAQKGIIRGSVIEDNTGEPMFAVTVVIDGTSIGASTDFDGKFEIKADPGTYNLKVSFVSYKTIIIENVVVKANDVSLFENIRMLEDVETLEEIVVTAEVVKTTEEALLTVKKKSANLIDGISSANFRRIGDSDAASAVKRVPGVSLEGGKYVYVRGLGDRYTKSILNGVDIPGLDPDRNTLQMDIFPTNVIDNIIVIKSFTADLPADFTGGVVNITTKDFPEEKVGKFSIGGSYNPNMHFNSEYLDYEGGKTDFLGFDDGTRDIPTGGSTDIPFRSDALGDAAAMSEMNTILNNFNPTLAAMRQNSFMDYSLGFSLGNQKAAGNSTLGYNLALTYKNKTTFYEDAEYNRWGRGNTADILELDPRERQKGDLGTNDVLLGGLLGFARKGDYAKYSLNILHLQNGESKAGIFNYVGSDQGSNFTALQHNLEYSERRITNILLNGNHYIAGGTWEVEWKLSPTRSKIEDPDIRFTRYRVEDGVYSIGTESGIPERIWRNLEEDNLAGKLDITRKYSMGSQEGKLKFGSSYTYKTRNYEIQNFQIFPGNINQSLTGDPNEIFQTENFISSENRSGVYYDPQFIPNNPNKYESNNSNLGIYVSNEIGIGEKVKTILGVRAEQYQQNYTGTNQQGDSFDNEEVLNSLNFFPSANLIYSLSDNQNLRVSFSRTIARPSFKEASYAEILDPITGRTFIGGLFPDQDSEGNVIWDGNLKETNINNFDIRWEVFPKGGQTFAISAFYKTFKNPIEIVQYVQAANNFQPRNVGDGQVLGAELELRKNLQFISEMFSAFSFNANVTVTKSTIDMSATEYNSRLDNAREGQEIDDTREMAGQAPYIINAGLQYAGFENGFEAGIYYNVQGRTLMFVGIADRPDIYSVPFHSLNFNANKDFGPNDRMNLNFSVSNILNDTREQVFESFGATDRIFNRLKPSMSFGLSFGYSFF